MKFIFNTVISACLLTTSCNSQDNTTEVTLKVCDENHAPLEKAKASISSLNYKGEVKVGYTNAQGLVSLRIKKSPIMPTGATKDGYYSSRGIDVPIGRFWKVDFDKSDPIKIILKKVQNPIAMYARAIDIIIPPEHEVKCGYDLEIGDWVAPHGKGKTTDIFFNSSGVTDWAGLNEYKSEFTVNFPNRQDGLVMYESEKYKGSELTSDYEAPLTGYIRTLTIVNQRKLNGVHQSTSNPKANYYFRVRTKLNKQGEIESARYGKIYGEFPNIIYYLNPAPNDRNVEFDFKNNLFRNLHWEEKVKNP